MDAAISKEDSDYIRGFQVREAFGLTWWEYLNQPKWVNEVDFALLLTRGKALQKED